jgi:23S rRNA pseudouridine2604 synthase
MNSDNKLTRINKYLSEIGYCSRREADRLIELNKVKINGEIPEIGSKISIDDKIEIDGKIIQNKQNKFVYIAFNKPVGIVCTTDTKREKNNIIDFLNLPYRIFPIGRLDKSSEGLILLTNDGDIVNKILRSKNEHEKEYIVEVNLPINQIFIEKMKNGIPILNVITKKCFVEKLDKYKFRIILTQGLNRQIRRMCEYLGYRVRSLKRIRIMNINLDIPVGIYRNLTKKELEELNKLCLNSKKNNE